MYISRTIEPHFIETAENFMAMLVVGARQVGKTTLLRRLGEKIGMEYTTFDDPITCELARRDPALFMQRLAPSVIIDEIQYCPSILPYIKMEIDKIKTVGSAVEQRRNFWLSGSQQFQVMRGVSESLAGRVAIISLFGLSNAEMNGTPSNWPFIPSREMWGKKSPLTHEQLFERIWRGSLPGIFAGGADKDIFYSSYTQTYIERDVRALSQVGDESAFLRFLRACAARTAQQLNLSSIARDADIAPNTAKNWLSILSASGIIFLLEPFHTNLTKRLVKAPKIYFTDTGLCSWLTGWDSARTLEIGAMGGAILETWAVMELLKSYSHNMKQPRFFYYRDKDQVEIDLLISQNGEFFPVEIKKTASPKGNAVNVAKLEKLGLKMGHAALLCLVPEATPLSQTCTAFPIGAL